MDNLDAACHGQTSEPNSHHQANNNNTALHHNQSQSSYQCKLFSPNQSLFYYPPQPIKTNQSQCSFPSQPPFYPNQSQCNFPSQPPFYPNQSQCNFPSQPPFYPNQSQCNFPSQPPPISTNQSQIGFPSQPPPISTNQSQIGFPSYPFSTNQPLFGYPPQQISPNHSQIGYPPQPISPNHSQIGYPLQPISPNQSQIGYPLQPISPNQSQIGYPLQPISPNQSHIGYPPQPISPNQSHIGYPPQPISPNQSHIGYPPQPISPNQSQIGYPLQPISPNQSLLYPTLTTDDEPIPTEPLSELRERSRSCLTVERLVAIPADPQIEMFQKMVACLRNDSELTDICYLGLIFNPLVQLSTVIEDSTSEYLNVEIRSSLLETPFKKVLNSNVKVYDLTKEVIVSVLGDVNLYLLRIWGRSEYLHPHSALSNHAYVQECCRQDLALKLVLEERKQTKCLSNENDKCEIDVSWNVTREKVDIYLETINRLVNDLKNRQTIPTTSRPVLPLEQAVKAVTLAMDNFTSVDIQRQLLIVSIKINKLISEPYYQFSSDNFERELDRLEEAVINHVAMVCRLMKTNFSIAPSSNRESDIDARNRSNNTPKCSTQCPEPIIVNVISVYRLNEQLADSFESIRCELVLSYAGQPLRCYKSDSRDSSESIVVTSTASNALQETDPKRHQEVLPAFVSPLIFDQWMKFEGYSVKSLPRETVLKISLYGVKKSQDSSNSGGINRRLGWANLPLFDTNSKLLQGTHLIGLWPATSNEPRSATTQLNTSKEAVLIQIGLPEYSHDLVFPSFNVDDFVDIFPQTDSSNEDKIQFRSDANSIWLGQQLSLSSSMETVTITGQKTSGSQQNIKQWRVRGGSMAKTVEMSAFFWSSRDVLLSSPEAIVPFILALTRHWPPQCIEENANWAKMFTQILGLLERFEQPEPPLIIRLLSPEIPDQTIRKKAVHWLNQLHVDQLEFYLPQLIECLKYDHDVNFSGLSKLLLSSAIKSLHFANALYWQLKECPVNSCHSQRLQMVFSALLRCSGSGLRSVWRRQEEVVKMLSDAAELIRNEKNSSEKDKYLQDLVNRLTHMLQEFRVPFSPGHVCCKLVPKSCKYFSSNTSPLQIVFENIDDEGEKPELKTPLRLIFKNGDDLRRDEFITQMTRLMDIIWLKRGLDLRMVQYRVRPTSDINGFIELVEHCSPLRIVQSPNGSLSGPFNIRGIIDWLRSHNSTEELMKKAVENFLLSSAGCCVSTYILGIGDRHNDNIMVRYSGHVFHIDFAKVLGNAQKVAGLFNKDRVPFVFTPDMEYVLKYYDTHGGEGYGLRHFIDKCCEAYIILRENMHELMSAMYLMTKAGIPDITEESIKFTMNALRPEIMNDVARQHFTGMVYKTINSKSMQLIHAAHNAAQLIAGGIPQKPIFSFTPNVYTNAETSNGKIEKIDIVQFLREKDYAYKIAIYRYGSVPPDPPEFVYRKSSEWLELANALSERFPAELFLDQPVIQSLTKSAGSENSVVAEGRRSSLGNFVNEILQKNPEISQCDLVESFFRPILRDAEYNRESVDLWAGFTQPRPLQAPDTHPKVRLRLSLSETGTDFNIIVMHAECLRLPSGEAPDSYAKIYLRPSQKKSTKQKSQVVRKSHNPSFNAPFNYTVTANDISTKKWEVSIFYKYPGKNVRLGYVFRALNSLRRGQQLEELYDLIMDKESRRDPLKKRSSHLKGIEC